MNTEHPALGGFEQPVLMAILRVRDGGTASRFMKSWNRHAMPHAPRGAVYMTIDRLEKKRSWRPPSATHSRARRRAWRCYVLTRAAVLALKASRRTLLSLWDGLEPVLGK